ncbi:MAG: DUF937 domain-containing protein [Sphingomonadaceae bacterium]
MQQLLNALGGAEGIAAMARDLGVDQGTVEKGAAALLPMVLGGFKQQAQAQPQGLAGLVGMLSNMGGGSLLDAVLAPKPTPVDQGNQVLGQIFGSKDVSRTVAQQAAGSTGLSPDLLKQMLPMVAMAAAGFMAKQASAAPAAGGGAGGMLGQVVSALTGGGRQQAGGVGNLMQLLDMDGDGNPLNDVMRLMKR